MKLSCHVYFMQEIFRRHVYCGLKFIKHVVFVNLLNTYKRHNFIRGLNELLIKTLNLTANDCDKIAQCFAYYGTGECKLGRGLTCSKL